MRGILEEVDAQAKKLRRYDSAVIEGPPKNAERFARDFDGMGLSEVEGSNLMAGRELQIASAVGFVKACLDITQNEESLVLGAKAILAARLALNTLPKACPSISKLIAEFTTVLSNFTGSLLKSSNSAAETNRSISSVSSTSRTVTGICLHNGLFLLGCPPTLAHDSSILNPFLLRNFIP